MAWYLYFFLLESAVLIIAFTLIIMISLCIKPTWWLHDYPKDIQEAYFETHERVPTEAISKTVFLKKLLAILFSTAVLVIMASLCGTRRFFEGFLFSYALWLVIDWYDCLFFDWLIFANIKRVRLPGTEHMDKAYHQKKYHVMRSLNGMAIGLIPCIITGIIAEIM